MAAGSVFVMIWIVDLFVEQWRWPGPVTLASFSDYLVQYVFVVAFFCTLLTIVSLHALKRRSYGWVGSTSSLFAFLGQAILLYSVVATLVLGATLEPPNIVATGLLAALVGTVILGLATLLSGILPRWCGVLLVVCYILPVFFGIGYNGWTPYGFGPGLAWTSVGYVLLSSEG